MTVTCSRTRKAPIWHNSVLLSGFTPPSGDELFKSMFFQFYLLGHNAWVCLVRVGSWQVAASWQLLPSHGQARTRSGKDGAGRTEQGNTEEEVLSWKDWTGNHSGGSKKNEAKNRKQGKGRTEQEALRGKQEIWWKEGNKERHGMNRGGRTEQEALGEMHRGRRTYQEAQWDAQRVKDLSGSTMRCMEEEVSWSGQSKTKWEETENRKYGGGAMSGKHLTRWMSGVH